MFDRIVNEIPCDKVAVDDSMGAQIAVETLINKGAKKIALITTKDYISVGRLRTQGHIKALEKYKIDLIPELILKIDDNLLYENSLQNLESQIKILLAQHPDLDGFLAVNELYAAIAMNVAKGIGIKIPEELQVIGFTDGMLSKTCNTITFNS